MWNVEIAFFTENKMIPNHDHFYNTSSLYSEQAQVFNAVPGYFWDVLPSLFPSVSEMHAHLDSGWVTAQSKNYENSVTVQIYTHLILCHLVKPEFIDFWATWEKQRRWKHNSDIQHWDTIIWHCVAGLSEAFW